MLAVLILIVVVVAGFLLFEKIQKPTVFVLPIAPLVFEKSTEKYYTMELSYPRSSATQYPEIYNFIGQTKADFLSQFDNISDSDAADMGITSDNKWDLEISTRVATSTQTATYIVSVYTFTGGAHGNTSVETFTYDARGKLVTLDDFFAAPYLEKVAGLARTYFYNTLGDEMIPSMVDAGTEATTTNFSAWYLTDENLTFIFQSYQVGPYVIGMPEFSIARNALSDIISKQYK